MRAGGIFLAIAAICKEGTDGVDKMSKSLGNYIGIDESPREVFGKLMSISDELMYKYYELLTDENLNEVKTMHPMDAKKKLARLIVTQYHNAKEADTAQANFEVAFKDKGFPENAEQKTVKPSDIVSALSEVAGQSKSEIRRKLSEGAVEVNGAKEKDPAKSLAAGTEYQIRIGKRFYRLKVE